MPRFFTVSFIVAGGILVDRVVRQVHANVVLIFHIGLLIGFCAETSESHLMHVNPERLNPIQEDIEAKVVFEVVDQVRLRYVLLDDVAAARFTNTADDSRSIFGILDLWLSFLQNFLYVVG